MTGRGSQGPGGDAGARRLIAERLDETLFVEAGAGTGKTRALVDRVLALVLSGVPIDRIIVTTFTEKAAAELKERVRYELGQVVVAANDPEERAQTALQSLDRAQISTIHSLCQGLLRSYAAEAGVDPGFEVLDELAAERRFDEQWRIFLEGLATDAAAVAAIDRALGLGLTIRDLQTLASDLSGLPDVALLLEDRPLRARPVSWPDLQEHRRALIAVPFGAVSADDALRLRIEALLRLVERLLPQEALDREATLASQAGVLQGSFNKGRAAAWGPAIAGARAETTRVAEQLSATLAGLRSEALADVVSIVVRFVREDTDRRAREGRLVFDDLILRTQQLLERSAAAAGALRRRYHALFIDEFQDTDPLQVAIARAFAVDPVSGRLDTGRLFLVGDPKQSIYRFRRADTAVYARTRAEVEDAGALLPILSLNRRSRPIILDWINGVFATLIGPGGEPAIQPTYHAIYPERDDLLAGPGVATIGGDPPDPALRAREVRVIEAVAVAAQCRAVVEEGWEVADRQDRTVRAARLRDVAILIPTRAMLLPLERALANAGIPCRVEGGSLVHRTQELRDLVNCLAAIDDPSDEVAIVAALRSPALACSDLDLARHRAAGGRFDYIARDGAHRSGRVGEALRALAAYHGARHESPLAALVQRLVADLGIVETGILDQGGRDGYRRMRFVVEQARTFEASGPQSLRAFVDWLQRRARREILDNEGTGLDEDEDAVRILTIHGAKGLEFPIVVLAGIGSAPLDRPGAYTFDRVAGDVGVAIGAKTRNARFELGPVAALATLESRHSEAEYARLLYVGATRARDHLVVSLYHADRAKRSGARLLIDAGARRHARPLGPPARVAAPAVPFSGLTAELPEDLGPEQLAAMRHDLVDSASTRRYTSATSLGAAAKEESTDATEPWARGRGATHVGRAVHAAIQATPLDALPATIAAFARAQSVAEAIPERSEEVRDLVAAALQSDAAHRARAARRSLREVPFAFMRGSAVVEGFIDLVIETAEGLEIVDWKTDAVEPDEVDARLAGYALQAGFYVLGLESAAGRRVARVTYVFVRAGDERSPGDPAALAAAAEGTLAGAAFT